MYFPFLVSHQLKKIILTDDDNKNQWSNLSDSVALCCFHCCLYLMMNILITVDPSTGTCGSSMTRVPLGDRHMALSLLLHLALQRATLSTMLTVITLLLQLWDSGRNQVKYNCIYDCKCFHSLTKVFGEWLMLI